MKKRMKWIAGLAVVGSVARAGLTGTAYGQGAGALSKNVAAFDLLQRI